MPRRCKVTAEKKTLASKIAKVMEAVGYVPKTGTNSAQGYKFVQASVVADKVREQLAKLNVSMTPTTIDMISEGLTPSGKQALMTLRFTWTLTDGDSGETISFQSIGSGADSGDKAAYKAATGALKYALLTGFLVPTGDDPEADPATDEKVLTAAKKIFEDPKPSAAKADDFDGLQF
jgi:hypothetical protein